MCYHWHYFKLLTTGDWGGLFWNLADWLLMLSTNLLPVSLSNNWLLGLSRFCHDQLVVLFSDGNGSDLMSVFFCSNLRRNKLLHIHPLIFAWRLKFFFHSGSLFYVILMVGYLMPVLSAELVLSFIYLWMESVKRKVVHSYFPLFVTWCSWNIYMSCQTISVLISKAFYANQACQLISFPFIESMGQGEMISLYLI